MVFNLRGDYLLFLWSHLFLLGLACFEELILLLLPEFLVLSLFDTFLDGFRPLVVEIAPEFLCELPCYM